MLDRIRYEKGLVHSYEEIYGRKNKLKKAYIAVSDIYAQQ